MRVERLQEEFDLEVAWQPFELHPSASGGPPEGIDRSGGGSGRRGAYLDHLRELSEEAGLTFRPPTIVPNSHRSLEAAEFAREQGAFAPYHRALFEAYFARGQDIGDVAVLAELGAANGVDPQGLREALQSGRYASLVDERTAGGAAVGHHRHADLHLRERRPALPHRRRAGARCVRERSAADGGCTQNPGPRTENPRLSWRTRGSGVSVLGSTEGGCHGLSLYA